MSDIQFSGESWELIFVCCNIVPSLLFLWLQYWMAAECRFPSSVCKPGLLWRNCLMNHLAMIIHTCLMRGMNKNSVVVVDDERLATQSEFLFQLERERASSFWSGSKMWPALIVRSWQAWSKALYTCNVLHCMWELTLCGPRRRTMSYVMLMIKIVPLFMSLALGFSQHQRWLRWLRWFQCFSSQFCFIVSLISVQILIDQSPPCGIDSIVLGHCPLQIDNSTSYSWDFLLSTLIRFLLKGM